MAVTENDVIQNAGAIAALINAAADVTIGDLTPVTTMADTDPLHIQVSGVDKNIEKSDFQLLIVGKNNYVATTNPAITDDSGDGYSVGSRWINTSLDTTWECADSTVGAAVWVQTNASGGSGEPKEIPFTLRGAAYVGNKQTQILKTYAGTIGLIYAYVDTAPTGAAIMIDIMINGVSIFSVTPANRPTIAIGANSAVSGVPDVTAITALDRVSVNILQIGSTIGGGSDTLVNVKLV